MVTAARLLITGRNHTLPRDVAQATGEDIAPRYPRFRRFTVLDDTLDEPGLARWLHDKFFDCDGIDRNEEKRLAAAEEAAKRAAEEEACRLKIQMHQEAIQRLEQKKALYATIEMPVIVDAVCVAHQVGKLDVLSETRSYRIAHARQHAVYLAREITGLPWSRIARFFSRDHGTCIHAYRIWPKHAARYEREVAAVNQMLGLTQ